MMELIKYRDAGMNTYTYFWKNANNNIVSPLFDSEKDAMNWANDPFGPPPNSGMTTQQGESLGDKN